MKFDVPPLGPADGKAWRCLGDLRTSQNATAQALVAEPREFRWSKPACRL